MTEQEIIERIDKGEPFIGISNIRLRGKVEPQPKGIDQSVRPDLAMGIEFNNIPIQIYGTIKTQVTPKILKEIGLWLARLNESDPNIRYVLICPFLSPESQKYCQENRVDFIDLCGNILIRIPGKVLIQRLNQPNLFKAPQLLRNPFFGASSRVARVLLQFPKRVWTVSEIQQELIEESFKQGRDKYFQISLSSISKAIKSLEEALLIRRDGVKVVVPEPKQLLFNWIEKYQKQYRWARYPRYNGAQYVVEAWKCNNPFGFDIKSSVQGLRNQFPNLQTIVTGSAAASFIAPFVNIDQIDIFILDNYQQQTLLDFTSNTKQGKGPEFLFIYPYDQGVAMYARKIDDLTVASDIQTYLDCYALGGRDAKQAEYLLTNIIEKQWNKK
ncbi:MAG: hypothetical protein V1701_03635 [Planctomycetota bacterium]